MTETMTTEVQPAPVTEAPMVTVGKKIHHLKSECATADEIAAFLHGLGIKGSREDSQHCPIANWLSSFGLTSIYVGAELVLSEMQNGYVLLPSQVRDFIDGFDEGKYPDLIG